MTIHPTAIIEPGAQLGDHIKVGPYTYIQSGVTVGDNCAIASHVAILAGTRLGNNCKVHAGAVLGDIPQDLAFQDEPSQLKIGNNCVIREGVTAHRGTKAGTETVVGDDCLLMAYSHLAHNVRVGDRVIIANGALVAGYAEIGDRAFISGNCLIHQFTRVGRLAMMSGGCAIQKDVPPFCITRSLSTNTVMGLNTIGLRRAGFTEQQRRELQNALKILYRSQLNVSQALEKLESDFTSDLVRELCEFIRTSQRGICKFI
ncbi:MAG: acyl-ACP--UDP-N-acetylglucosamine O-acyltransferase [Limnospira sp.]